MGLNELKIKDERLKIFPNPADEMLNVELAHSRGSEQEMLNAKLEIINTLGQTLQTFTLSGVEANKPFQTTTINIKELPNGIYTISIQHNGSKSSSKLIIQH